MWYTCMRCVMKNVKLCTRCSGFMSSTIEKILKETPWKFLNMHFKSRVHISKNFSVFENAFSLVCFHFLSITIKNSLVCFHFLSITIKKKSSQPTVIIATTYKVKFEKNIPYILFLLSIWFFIKVILVGHDFGGACISYAMELFPLKISKAVFIAAAMPTNGQSTLDIISQQVFHLPLVLGIYYSFL